MKCTQCNELTSVSRQTQFTLSAKEWMLPLETNAKLQLQCETMRITLGALHGMFRGPRLAHVSSRLSAHNFPRRYSHSGWKLNAEVISDKFKFSQVTFTRVKNDLQQCRAPCSRCMTLCFVFAVFMAAAPNRISFYLFNDKLKDWRKEWNVEKRETVKGTRDERRERTRSQLRDVRFAFSVLKRKICSHPAVRHVARAQSRDSL